MRKLITDFNKCPAVGEDNNKTLVCSQVEAGKVFADQLQCCFDGKCSSDLNSCLDYGDKYISKCHNITVLDACRRTDALSRQICGWQGSLFCLTTRSTSNVSDYAHLHEAIKWMVSRNRVEESYNNVTACLETTGDYQLCNSAVGTVGTVNLSCNDLFEDGCNSCSWTSGGTKAIRRIKGELCEIMPTNTITTTTTAVYSSSYALERSLTVGIGFPICLVLGALVGIGILLLRERRVMRIGDGNPHHLDGGNPLDNHNNPDGGDPITTQKKE